MRRGAVGMARCAVRGTGEDIAARCPYLWGRFQESRNRKSQMSNFQFQTRFERDWKLGIENWPSVIDRTRAVTRTLATFRFCSSASRRSDNLSS